MRRDDDESVGDELTFAIEMKYIHLFNTRSIQMLKEVIVDNEKLRLARHHSEHTLRPINLVFCSSRPMERKGGDEKAVVEQIRDYVAGGKATYHGGTYEVPDDVLTVFVQSCLKEDGLKQTDKPICHYEGNDDLLQSWAKEQMT